MVIYLVVFSHRVISDYYNSVEITNKMQPCNRIYYSTVGIGTVE